MVTVSREWCGWAQCWSYMIEARVPHEWASKEYEYFCGKGHGHITTAYKDVTLISISETHPEFEKVLAHIIKSSTEKEDNKISEIEDQIESLYQERNALIDKMYGKDVKRKCKV